MIPLRLHLSNFLSYGDSCDAIEFDGIHVACLCGPNGHGKSALLDGITWALWGQARSNSADDLVRLGQAAMLVELEFLLDGQRYRVIRKRNRGRAGQSDLQFQSRQPDGEWRALTGQGVRGTQERINAALRMDYETFINSAFILQGRADEFARKTAGDRKRILGEILSLGVYDQLSEAARARRGEALMRVNALEAQITQMEREHVGLPDLRAQVERLTAEHAAARLALEGLRAELHGVRVEKTRLDARRAERDDLVRRLARAETELNALRGQLSVAERKVAAAQALVARAEAIRVRARELFAASKERDEMNARLAELRKLEGEQSRHQRKLEETRYALDTKLQLARQRVRELNACAEQLPHVQAELVDLEGQSVALDRLAEERAVLQARLQELAAETAEAGAELRRCMEGLESADERFNLLKGARSVCPTCDGALPDEKRLELGRRLREEKAALKEAQGQAIQRQSDAKKKDTETRRALQELDGKLRTGQVMRDRLAQARQRHLQLAERTAELPAELEHAQGLEALLQSGEFAPEVTAALAEVSTRIKSLGYNERRQREIAGRLQELAGAERDLHALEAAETALPGELQEVQTLKASIQGSEEAIADDRAARAEADRELTRAPAVDAEAARLAAAVQKAETGEAVTSRALGAATETLARCEALGPQIQERKRERAAAAKDQALYEELAKAFGRNGIQALIIENALPEIEAEANALLGRMSDGQLSVRLKTQRELRAGGQAETLEIEISDSMGARRYELYSGGEAFRVNFAIRIALSKLLARRAGARLETLIIDEGFGSQDGDGRVRLVEAIHAVQDDFAKILVITHIDELKDAFPTRIEVTKGPLGSQVAVY